MLVDDFIHLCCRMQTAALAKFQEVKQQTVSGLKNSLQERKFIDVAVCLQPTHLIVPENGVYNRLVTKV